MSFGLSSFTTDDEESMDFLFGDDGDSHHASNDVPIHIVTVVATAKRGSNERSNHCGGNPSLNGSVNGPFSESTSENHSEVTLSKKAPCSSGMREDVKIWMQQQTGSDRRLRCLPRSISLDNSSSNALNRVASELYKTATKV
jgi:hypothetical protein